MFCTSCGNKITDDARFCTLCGRTVTPAPVPETAQLPTPAATPAAILAPIPVPTPVPAVVPVPAVPLTPVQPTPVQQTVTGKKKISPLQIIISVAGFILGLLYAYIRIGGIL